MSLDIRRTGQDAAGASGKVAGATSVTAGVGLLAGLGAFASVSCCVLPIVLAMAGIGGAWVRELPYLAFYRDPLLLAAAAPVALGWLLIWRARRRGCGSGGRLPVLFLGLASLLLALSLTAAWWEPQALRLLALARGGT